MTIVNSYIISVSAGKGCYRHIRISAAATLFELHEAILDAFGFFDDHAHAFFMDNHLWSETGGYYAEQIDEESRYTCDFTINHLDPAAGTSFKYVFDFGNEWVFQCKVLQVLDALCEAPTVVRRVGDSPEQYHSEDSFEDSFDDAEDLAETDFPEVFKPAKLKKLYAKLPMTEETVELLHNYFDAMAHLYGVITLRKALEIINTQNEPISEVDFISFTEIVRHEKQYYSILGEDELYADGTAPEPLEREIVEESLYMFDLEDYVELVKAQSGKPYYIPGREVLLKYADEEYFEQTPQSRAMLDYLRKEKKIANAQAEDMLFEMQLDATIGAMDLQQLLGRLENLGLELTDMPDAQRFITLYTELSNHTRLPQNRGYTPEEMSAMRSSGNKMPQSMVFGPNMTKALQRGKMDIQELRQGILQMNMPSEALRQSMLAELNRIGGAGTHGAAPVIKETKVGRNEFCPCGSGKKYKKCCGKDQ